MNSRNDPELQPRSRSVPDCLYGVSAALRSFQRTGEFSPARRNQSVIRIRVVQVHFCGFGRIAQPDERTHRAAHQCVLLLSTVEPVWSAQPFLRSYLPANRTRLEVMTAGADRFSPSRRATRFNFIR